jgi:hypothetical protein
MISLCRQYGKEAVRGGEVWAHFEGSGTIREQACLRIGGLASQEHIRDANIELFQ